MFEQNLRGEVLMRGDVEKHVIDIKARLSKGDFSSRFNPDWTIDLDIDHVFGWQGRFGPTVEGVSESEKAQWLDEMLVIIEGLKIPNMDEPIVKGKGAAFSPTEIIERIRVARRRVSEKSEEPIVGLGKTPTSNRELEA